MSLPDALLPEDFSVPVTDHGFAHVHEDMASIPDHVHLGWLPAVTVDLDQITVASQHCLHPGILAEYTANPPTRKRIILRPYGGDDIAVADGHHAIVAARLRGETTIRARWMS